MSAAGGAVFEVLGPVRVRSAAGDPVDVKGPRHRAVLARLLVARGRAVPLGTLIDDLWEDEPPRGPAAALRTFVSALRVALEPGRPARAPARLLVTRGTGYALVVPDDRVDARRFEAALATVDGAAHVADRLVVLERALTLWRGAAYADFADARWARAERARLGELRLAAVERLGRARLDAGRPRDAVPDLDAHVTDHPWREEGWRLLAVALYRSERQGDALAVLRRARARLADELGLDPSPAMARLETDVLRRSPDLDPAAPDPEPWGWSGLGPRARLESSTSLLRSVVVHGGGPDVGLARHAGVVAAAEEIGDPDLTARVIGAFDVPSVWYRSDDPVASAAVRGAAERTLRRLGPGAAPAVRVRLLTAIAIETRGLPGPCGRTAADEAEDLARRLGDPTVLATALGGRVAQSFAHCGMARERLAIGRELVDLADRHDLPTAAVHARFVVLQAHCALGALDAAADEAGSLLDLGRRHELPAVDVLVEWFRALESLERGAPDVEARYRTAAGRLAGRGMPGVREGLLAMALVAVRLRGGRPVGDGADLGDLGPYAPWIRPHLLLAAGRDADAAAAVAVLPDPVPGHLAEALWCLAGRAAVVVGDGAVVGRAAAALAPAGHELAGAASGMLAVGPVADDLALLRDAAERQHWSDRRSRR